MVKSSIIETSLEIPVESDHKQNEDSGEASTSVSAQSKAARRIETLSGILIAFFAAILAVNDLGSGKFGDDELISHNQKNNTYLWFQTKGVKETLVEEQRHTLQALLAAGTVQSRQIPVVEEMITTLEKKAARYAKDRNELLLGSSVVGKENWSQELDGKMGTIVGAKQWEAKAAALDEAGDRFDIAALFLQICLVIGAVSLIVRQDKLRRIFFLTMIGLGVMGAIFSSLAYYKAIFLA